MCRLWEGLQSVQFAVTVLFIYTGYLYLSVAAIYNSQFTLAISADPPVSVSLNHSLTKGQQATIQYLMWRGI